MRQNPYVTDETQYYVYYSEDTYSGGEPVPVTVSEAHGYGMLIAVSMADYDPEPDAIFDWPWCGITRRTPARSDCI